jgi:hypothetical protein
VVVITLDDENAGALFQSWVQLGGVCDSCGTWFQATDVIDQWLITGEAQGAATNGHTRDYRLERQAMLKDDRVGSPMGIVRDKGKD